MQAMSLLSNLHAVLASRNLGQLCEQVQQHLWPVLVETSLLACCAHLLDGHQWRQLCILCAVVYWQ